MINLTPKAECMMIVLHFMTWTLFLCGILMWIERQGNPRERKILTSTTLIAAAMMLLRVVFTYREGIPDSYPVLPIHNLYGGYWALLLVSFYPIEATSPGWLTWKNTLLLLSPIIAITLILAVVPFQFRELYSWNDIMTYVGEANVWFRIILLFAIMIPYMVLLVFVPYNWRRSNIDVKWIRHHTIGIQGISVLYILFMLTGSLAVSTAHMAYCALFFIYVTYQELYLRLFGDAEKVSVTQVPARESLEQAQQVVSNNSLIERFTDYMSTRKPWMSPDITIGDVAKAIGVSRSKLSAEISAQGDDSFHAIVARYRVDEFCKMAQNKEVENVNEAMFAVGFRSRSTAYDRFKERTGMTPAEYIRTIRTGGR